MLSARRQHELQPAYVDHGLVFAREDGTPLSPETVTKTFTRLATKTGLRPVRLHDLRHGRASMMLASGAPLALVSKMLGHSSLTITSDTYSHLLQGVGRAAADAADALLRQRREHHVSTSPSTGHLKKTAGRVSETNQQVTGLPESGPPGDRTLNPRIKSRSEVLHAVPQNAGLCA